MKRRGTQSASEHEPLSNEDIEAVKREWEWHEMWYELEDRQKWRSYLPSIYNAALNKRARWVAAANAIIKYQMPQLGTPEHPDCATAHVNLLGTFAIDFMTWLRKFAQTMLECWDTP